jgi:large subunit ribosomal protein L23
MRQPHVIIKKVELTEKGARLSETENKYLFRVHPEAQKAEIKNAVENLFRVKVTKVNTMNRLGKAKRNRGGAYGLTSSWKRAVVTLKEGDKIDLTS